MPRLSGPELVAALRPSHPVPQGAVREPLHRRRGRAPRSRRGGPLSCRSRTRRTAWRRRCATCSIG